MTKNVAMLCIISAIIIIGTVNALPLDNKRFNTPLPEANPHDVASILNNIGKGQDSFIGFRTSTDEEGEAVSSSPCDETLGVSQSGYLNVNDGAQIFYAYIEAAQDAHDDELANDKPVALWLTGGPGVSGMAGMFLENGPCLLVDNGDGPTFVDNQHSWNKAGINMIYVDSPVGTGFSASDNLRDNEEDIANDLKAFLANFFDQEEFKSMVDNPFFIVGESYAGKYIPSLAHALLFEGVPVVNLHGIAIGNGMINPQLQTASYADFLYQFGMIDDIQHSIMDEMTTTFQKQVEDGHYVQAYQTENNILEYGLEQAGGPSVYDLRTYHDPTLPLISTLTAILNSEKVQNILGVNTQWSFGSSRVQKALVGDEARSVQQLLERVVDSIPVMLYTGSFDLICNHVGVHKVVESLSFSGSALVPKTPRELWTVDGQVAGFRRKLLNLEEVVVYGASHQVPIDKPKEAVELFSAFVHSNA